MKKLKLSRHHGDDLTAHDVLKTLALLFMIIDHIGHFFFPELDWLRIIGRFSAPIWFFLIGYTGTRKVPDTWWYGGGILALSAGLIGGYLLPLNILFTLAIVRLCIDPLTDLARSGRLAFAVIFVLLVGLAMPSTYILEYGTLGLLWAFYGAIQRREKEGPIRPAVQAALLTVMVAVSFLFQALILPLMGPSEYMALAFGMAVVFIALQSFVPARWPGAKKIPGLVPPLRFTGRWTLEIYVVHLLAFRLAAFLLNPEKYGFLRPEIFMPALT